ncbi:unnamed protein product [Caenorhabditis brenneri]
MYDSHFDSTFFLREPEYVEVVGKISVGVAGLALVCIVACIGYYKYHRSHPQHNVIVNPVAEPERRDWGQRDDDEEEDQL